MNVAHFSGMFDDSDDGGSAWPYLDNGADFTSSGRRKGGQKPLRSRQRALCELEAELARKTEAFKQAVEERARLQNRIKVLEVVLPMREQQILLLKQKEQAFRHGVTETHNGLLRIVPGDGGSESTTSDSGMSSPAEEVFTRASAGLGPDLTGAPRGVPPAETRPTAPPGIKDGACGTPAHVIREFVASWKHWVREAGLILHAHDARPHDPGPLCKLATLREGLAHRWRALRLEYPHVCMDLNGLNVETGEMEEPCMGIHWDSVVQALRLSAEQVADCRAAMGLFQDRVQAVLAERRALTPQLAACLPAARCNRGEHTSGSCGELMLRMMHVSSLLRRNVMAEGQATELITDLLGSYLLSLVQIVRLSVLCYPYFPDIVAMLSTISEGNFAGGVDTSFALAKRQV